ncbi:MAG: hypothetical protein FWC16_03400 [Defluviitaleaceae bacterium]|nr:hypothetical protein [Defluviitaleaceae bacterium]MCL2273948.1 hypothetical protein [Defluviitaleaceae bacterium]
MTTTYNEVLEKAKKNGITSKIYDNPQGDAIYMVEIEAQQIVFNSWHSYVFFIIAYEALKNKK